MLMQSIHFGADNVKLDSFSNSALCNLAGNAFHGWAYAATHMLAQLMYEFVEDAKLQAETPSTTTATCSSAFQHDDFVDIDSFWA